MPETEAFAVVSNGEIADAAISSPKILLGKDIARVALYVADRRTHIDPLNQSRSLI